MIDRLDPEDFARSEAPGYVAGDGWIVWRVRPDLGGLVLWGHQGETEAQAVAALCNASLRGRPEPGAHFLSVLDLRRASAFDLPAFFSFDRWLLGVNASHPELRVAVLSDRSPACAALFGLIQLAAPRIVHAHHAEVEALLAEAHAPPGLLAHLDVLVTTLQGSRAQLRDVLRESLGRVSLSAAAKRIGRSARALQRELERAGTTFERERTNVRRQVFESVVGDLSLKLDAVAAQLGFASLREFSTAFRRTVGLSPRSYREKVSSASQASAPPPRTSA